jgi:hypothetical protein
MNNPRTTGPSARHQIITGLRQLADYLHAHPDLPVSEHGWDLSDYTLRVSDDQGRADVDRIAAILGVTPADDTRGGGHYTAAKAFGPITYRYVHVPARRRAIHDAWSSYADSITPDDPPEAA